jgi:hypothetical protein
MAQTHLTLRLIFFNMFCIFKNKSRTPVVRCFGPGDSVGRDVREAEGARLESVCTLTGYRGFESHSLRFQAYRTVPAVIIG